jgi:hypothetical protein
MRVYSRSVWTGWNKKVRVINTTDAVAFPGICYVCMHFQGECRADLHVALPNVSASRQQRIPRLPCLLAALFSFSIRKEVVGIQYGQVVLQRHDDSVSSVVDQSAEVGSSDVRGFLSWAA